MLNWFFQDRTFGAKRSPKWPSVRKEFLAENPYCSVCGTKGTFLKPNQVHHKFPFHLKPEMELEKSNLITLCEQNECHLRFGHLYSFRSYNPVVEDDASVWRTKIRMRP